MNDPWNDWETNPPPILTCHVREGCHASLPLVVIDKKVWDAVYLSDDGKCRGAGGGCVTHVKQWVYAPGAWKNGVIDIEKVELALIRRLQTAGALPEGDPARIANDLADPTLQPLTTTLNETREELKDGN